MNLIDKLLSVDKEELTKECTKTSDLLVLMDGVKEPNLKDERLLEHFGAATPKDLAELLFDGEIQEISDAINNFYKDQEDEATENDVKN